MSDECKHQLKHLSYVAWCAWAEKQTAKGKKQTQCPKCKLWFFAEEL